ncbi:MAG: GNAT family N-acetyltransferase [Fusobacterium sp.]|nr:GNAT family N-acetyltransferase [Fusobacterium sp.]
MFKMTPRTHLKLLDKVQVQHPVFGVLNVATRKSEDGSSSFATEVKNSLGKIFGYERFHFKRGENVISGEYIEVLPEYRMKKFGLGEILRLASIMLMKENKSSEFNIYAKDTAIGFHTKYGFKPQGAKIHAHGISMSLSLEDVLARRDFFNSLFQKHGIDYCI